MLTIKQNVLNANFIDKINLEIDKIHYDSSYWIFPGTNEQIYKLIRLALAETNLFSEKILKDAYIVIRCVKINSPTTAYGMHFDNYTNTWVLPLKIPKGNMDGRLRAWRDTRSSPSNAYSNLASKIFFQNPITIFFIKKYLLNKFLPVDISVGDYAYFNGFTTLHFNEPVQGERRSILIHYDKAFDSSPITKTIEKFSQYIAN